ncbi:MAG: hypothetical protein JO339_15100 [Alphaproteobacteria bacterium]|nr:hypothetical protein [Alphaproteobacteria bacterium]
MKWIAAPIVPLIAAALVTLPALAQTQGSAAQAPSSYYPAPPPEKAPTVQQGAPLSGLSSPLPASAPKIERTEIVSDSEAQLFSDAHKIVWGRYAKKGGKPGELTLTRQGSVWTVKGRIEGPSPGSEGDWASIDGTVARIAPNLVQIRGEVAFRVAGVEKGTACKVGGLLNFKRSGKSHVWRLAEGDNPCDGTQENFDLIYDRQVEKKPVPAQPKRS